MADDLADRLRGSGYRLTPQRQLILGAVEQLGHATPDEVLAAVREHDLKTLGRPEVDITEFNDGDSLNFTAEVDVRPEITLPVTHTLMPRNPAVIRHTLHFLQHGRFRGHSGPHSQECPP